MVPRPMNPTFMILSLHELAFLLLALLDVVLFLDHLGVLAHCIRDRRPSGVMTDLDDHFDDLLARDADVLRAAVVGMVAVRTRERDVRRERHELALAQAQAWSRPHVSEKMADGHLVELGAQR